MSKYPVEIGDDEGVADALNYLLSGPGGLGQNFAGFSAYRPDYVGQDPVKTPTYLTGNFRIPYSQTGLANLYVPAFDLSNAEQLDDRTIKYTFATPHDPPPFSLGNGINVTGIVPDSYNKAALRAAGTSINQIGVVECTTEYVIVRTVASIMTPLGPYVSGGQVSYSVTANFDDSDYISTDCNARVTITGATDRVFISGQLNQTISYDVTSGPSDLRIWVAINRYVGGPNYNPTNPDYLFERQATVARKIYNYPALSGTGTIDLETIFSTVVDQPDKGYYWYILEVIYDYPVDGTEIQVNDVILGLRSLSAQVVKQ